MMYYCFKHFKESGISRDDSNVHSLGPMYSFECGICPPAPDGEWPEHEARWLVHDKKETT